MTTRPTQLCSMPKGSGAPMRVALTFTCLARRPRATRGHRDATMPLSALHDCTQRSGHLVNEVAASTDSLSYPSGAPAQLRPPGHQATSDIREVK